MKYSVQYFLAQYFSQHFYETNLLQPHPYARTTALLPTFALRTFVLQVFALLCLSGCEVQIVMAQDLDKLSTKEFNALSFEDLLDIDLLQAASNKPMAKKETPGTVTLIKREEILNAGARDLIDVLRLVPGLEFGWDVQGNVGMGTRGNWGHEGKILLMLDGMQLNETLFATAQFANRLPLDIVDRIEIVRGPGSSFYGGYAELAVINIITRTAQEIDGISLSGWYGQMQRAFGRAGGSLSFGKKFGEVGITASAFFEQANRSDGTYTGLDSISYPIAGNNTLAPSNIRLGITAGDFQLRMLYDRFNTPFRENATSTLPKAISNDFTTLLADARYEIRLTDKLKLMPRLAYTWMKPWATNDAAVTDTSSALYGLIPLSDKRSQRILGSLTLAGDVTDNLFVAVGSEFYVDNAQATDIDPQELWFNGSKTVSYNNIGAYIQALWTTPIVNINGGLRFDRHSAVPSAFVPWLGVTKVWDKFHFKALFGQNFRAPSIENIRINTGIRPERTTAFELELGYQLTYNLFVSANVFDNQITDPIVFGLKDGADTYANFDRAGTRGFEVEAFFKEFWGFVSLNYSYYDALHNLVSQYAVRSYTTTAAGTKQTLFENARALLGFANHKIALNSSIRLAENLTINPSAIWLGNRYAVSSLEYNAVDEQIGQTVHELPSTLTVNLFLRWQNVVLQGLEVGVGAYNILAAEYSFIQPYNSGTAPVAAPTREFLIKLSYPIKWGM